MNWFKKTYNKIYFGFILSIVIVFFCFRPLNSPWERFIIGDGIGYYSYLPATYIYNDANYEFKWFNKVYNTNYVYSSFNSPDDNFLVHYKEKKINKYYPGLSLIWLPFFAIAHSVAKLFHFPADGYSFPYQLCIGLASLFYLFLGLFYLRKLLQKLFNDEFVSTIIPIVIFYGTYLFYYSLFLNSQSHVYSFAFISAFIYYAYSFLNDSDKKMTTLLLSMLCFSVLVSIRPLNGLIIFIVPALISPDFFKEKFKLQFQKLHFLILLLISVVIINLLRILYIQTHSFIPYTYVNEKFYFNNPKLYDVLFSYHAGLFVYIPIAFVSIIGIYFLKNIKQQIIFPAIFVLAIYLYSSWWYWPITSRALIDFYPIIAILLAAILHKTISNKKMRFSFVTLLFILVGYHQLKSMQLHNGILDENYTHSELFWRNFFKIHKTNQYSIPPTAIIKQETYLEDFEKNTYKGAITNQKVHGANNAVVLNKESPFSGIFEFSYPKIFETEGIKKIRFSYWSYCSNEISSIQIYIKFYDEEHQQLFEIPFYINQEKIIPDTWNFNEFGCELSNGDFEGKPPVKSIEIFIWDNENKNEIFIDDVKTEFITMDNSYEVRQ